MRFWLYAHTRISFSLHVLCSVQCLCDVLLAPVDSSIDGLHLAQHGQQQGRFPTTHLAHDHRQLTCTDRKRLRWVMLVSVLSNSMKKVSESIIMRHLDLDTQYTVPAGKRGRRYLRLIQYIKGGKFWIFPGLLDFTTCSCFYSKCQPSQYSRTCWNRNPIWNMTADNIKPFKFGVLNKNNNILVYNNISICK